MTRKDYIMIAEIFYAEKPDMYGARITREAEGRENARQTLAHKMADALARDNPRFNRAAFLIACNVDNVR